MVWVGDVVLRDDEFIGQFQRRDDRGDDFLVCLRIATPWSVGHKFLKSVVQFHLVLLFRNDFPKSCQLAV